MASGSTSKPYFNEEANQASSPEQQRELVKEQFGRTAKAYVESPSHGNPVALTQVVDALDPQWDWTVLDIATGGGHVAKAVAGCVSHVVASDLTASMLAEARHHIRDVGGLDNVSYVIADAENLPFLKETFDAVTCRIAPHHFPDPSQFVREVARVLKPGGRFLLVDNIVPEDSDLANWYNTLERVRDESHVRCAARTEWKAWMNDAGLVCLSDKVSRKTFDFEPWCRRMVTSEHQYRQVVDFIMQAPEAAREYFAVQRDNRGIDSFQGLEWLAVCEKRPE